MDANTENALYLRCVTQRIIGWTYDADYHCNRHAIRRFGEATLDEDTVDSEGNAIHPVFRWDTGGALDDLDDQGVFADESNPTGSHCSECVYEMVAARA